jgi:hypothetical protein
MPERPSRAAARVAATNAKRSGGGGQARIRRMAMLDGKAIRAMKAMKAMKAIAPGKMHPRVRSADVTQHC